MKRYARIRPSQVAHLTKCQFKAANATNDAVVDDIAGKAYVEQFGLETFQRADNAVRANRASGQTADTFRASATFLDLLQIWGPIEPEITSKIKYAKFHAVRIVKALKAGEDPNLSNPKPEVESDEALPALDPNDAEVQMLTGRTPKPRQPSVVEVPDESIRQEAILANKSSLDESLHPSRASPAIPEPRPRQPSVVDVTDEADRVEKELAKQSILDESLHPSRADSPPRETRGGDVSPLAPNDPSLYYSRNAEVSPLNSPTEPERRPGDSFYFPPVPGRLDPSSAGGMPLLPDPPHEPSLPQAPTTFAQQPIRPHPPAAGPGPSSSAGPHALFPSAAVGPGPGPDSGPRSGPSTRQPSHAHFLPSAGPPHAIIPTASPTTQHPPGYGYTHSYYPQQQPSPAPVHPSVTAAPPTVVPAAPSTLAPTGEIDDMAMMAAQKHARWAISALDFEDVPTAIRELRAALASLGGLGAV